MLAQPYLYRSLTMAAKMVKSKTVVKQTKPIQGLTQYFYVNKNGYTLYTQSVGDVRNVAHVIWNQERDPATSIITHTINLNGEARKVTVRSASGSSDARYKAFENVRNEATKLLQRAKK